MTLTGPDVRIMQVHPTRRCNLRCVHCYSSSGPEERHELEGPLLHDAIRDASALGYNVLSISGGEPMLFHGLRDLCAEGRRQHMIVTLVTNGTVFDEARVAELAGSVDAIAISLDGAPDRHNRVRRHPGAFQLMEKRLHLLRNASIPLAFVFTLTRDNLGELEWAADFAVAQGAVMLQVHPVEEHGRAASDSSMQSLSDEDLTFAWMAVTCLRQIHDGLLAIQFDAHDRRTPVDTTGEIVSPLVIEDDGSVVPLRYGFPRSYAFGNLHRNRLADMAHEWRQTRARAFRDLFQQARRRMDGSGDRFTNMYQLLSDVAEPRHDLVAIA